MPLRAVIDGRTVMGPDLSREEWDRLARRHRSGLAIAMPCCGAPGHPRRSRSGTQHFYHAVRTGCQYADESAEHLAIKERVYRACRSRGWEAYTEFPAPGCSSIPDVFAEKDGRMIAFEIQISSLSPDLLEERDRKYRRAGIESWWLIEKSLLESRNFSARCDSPDPKGAGTGTVPVPYTDASGFAAGPEIPLFLTRGVMSAGLDTGKQVIAPAGRPAILIEDWVARVLRNEERGNLEEMAAFLQRKLELKAAAAPALARLREFYEAGIRDSRYRKRIDTLFRQCGKNGDVPESVRGRIDRIREEIRWLENEYRACMSDTGGLFWWKRSPGTGKAVPVFRLETPAQVFRLQEFTRMLDRWEVSFNRETGILEREIRNLRRR